MSKSIDELTQERGRRFSIDREDEEESMVAGMAGQVMGEFVRTKVAPEIDAYTFSKLAKVATDNGNIVSHELHAVSERQLYRGSALVILRAGQNPSDVKLIVEGEGFKTVELPLQTK